MESSSSGANSGCCGGAQLGEGPHPLAKSGGGGGDADGEHILLSDGSGEGTSVVQLGCPFNKIENEVIVYTLQLRLHKQSDCGLTCLSCDTGRRQVSFRLAFSELA